MKPLIVTAVIILLFACQCGQMPAPEPGLPTVTGTAVPSPTLPATPTRQISPTANATAVPTQIDTPQPTATVTAVPATVEPTGTAVPTATASATELPETYTVERDEWLILIAQRLYQSPYGWEWECLWQTNRAVIGDNPHLIYRGQKLRGIRECGE